MALKLTRTIFYPQKLDGWSLILLLLHGRAEYVNMKCESLAANFDIKPANSCSIPGAEGLVVFSKGSLGVTKAPLFSFVPPTGGMFIWARFYFSSSPRFAELQADENCVDPEMEFENELWAELAKALVGIL